MASVTHAQVTNWLIPVLLTLLVGILGWMGKTLSETLPVLVYRIEDHDRRLQNLETLFLNPHR